MIPVSVSEGANASLIEEYQQRWLDDPNNPRKTPDGLGSLNSVVVVPEEVHHGTSQDAGVSSMMATRIG